MGIDVWILTENVEYEKEFWLQMEQWTETIAYCSIQDKNWQERLKKAVTSQTVIGICLAQEGLSWEWVRKVRGITRAPIFVISEKESYYEEIECFQCGANDYQTREKPMLILKERIIRLVQQISSDTIYTKGGLAEEVSSSQFFYQGHSLALTPKEYQVLHWLLHSMERMVSRQKLLFHVWQKETPTESRALDTVIKQLRKKLTATPLEIKTCYGKGFQIINTQKEIEK